MRVNLRTSNEFLVSQVRKIHPLPDLVEIFVPLPPIGKCPIFKALDL